MWCTSILRPVVRHTAESSNRRATADKPRRAQQQSYRSSREPHREMDVGIPTQHRTYHICTTGSNGMLICTYPTASAQPVHAAHTQRFETLLPTVTIVYSCTPQQTKQSNTHTQTEPPSTYLPIMFLREPRGLPPPSPSFLFSFIFCSRKARRQPRSTQYCYVPVARSRVGLNKRCSTAEQCTAAAGGV